MTPHIEASKEDIASIVIMPGDPNRCTYIAKNYLENCILVNSVRGELAYTGLYKGKRVTIFSSGMGIPSMGIYSHELFSIYNVDTIIRIGSAGSYISELNLNDLFLVDSSFTESNYSNNYANSSDKIVYSSPELNKIILETANDLNYKITTGRCYTTECFYTENIDLNKYVNEYSCDCVEMESFSLLMNARHLNKKATCILTISDSLVTGDELTSEERESTFDKMIKIALESTLKI